MITQRIMSGLDFREIADLCGISVAQIERIYYHLDDEIYLTNTVAELLQEIRRYDGGDIKNRYGKE